MAKKNSFLSVLKMFSPKKDLCLMEPECIEYFFGPGIIQETAEGQRLLSMLSVALVL